MSEEELLVACLPDAPFKEKLIEVLGKKNKRITELEQQLKTAMESADAATIIVHEREKEIELLKHSAKKDKADAVRHILTFDRYSEKAIEEYANNLEGK